METFSDKGKLSKAFAGKHTCLKDILHSGSDKRARNSERKNIKVGKNRVNVSNCLSF